jgi:hypothetical protein
MMKRWKCSLREILTLIEVGSGLGVGRDDWVVMHLLENRFENQMVETAWAHSFPLLASYSSSAGFSHSQLSTPSTRSPYMLPLLLLSHKYIWRERERERERERPLLG